jgi:RimJ/RimL family protein N-acetyltransferase
MTHRHWPLWDIVLRTPRLELRTLREQTMADLVDVVDGGLHDPATMPFLTPFTDTEPPTRHRDSYRFYFGTWANWSPEDWHLLFVAYERDGDDPGAPARCVGSQGLIAKRFPVLRTVTSGSFLGLAHQGRGLGREMRAAVLTLAFDHLGALRAETEAWDDNLASQRVTEWIGYRPNGDGWDLRRGERSRTVHYAMDRADWEARHGAEPPLPTVGVDGIGPEALEMFGLS